MKILEEFKTNQKSLMVISLDQDKREEIEQSFGEFYRYTLFNGEEFKQGIHHYTFAKCGWDTELIIIKDCQEDMVYEEFFSLITDGLMVNKKMLDPFHIQSRFLFLSSFTPSIIESASFYHRVNITQI